MKANELRIGNWIEDHKGRMKKVWTIKQNAVQTSDYDIDEDEVMPILLTPEILEKCRFKKDSEWPDSTNYLMDGKLLIKEFKGAVRLAGYMDVLIIKYLHQLQNLYFALTGEELKIDL